MKLKKFYQEINSKKIKYFFKSEDTYKLIKANLSNNKNYGNILDLGCGDLSKFKFLKSLKFNRYVAVDWITPPKKLLNDKRINFIKSDIKKFKTKEKFNLILLVGTIEHFENPELLLKKIKKFMSKDSLLIISHPNYYNIRGIILLTCKFLYNAKVSLSDLKYFYPEEVKEVLHKIGFSRVKVQTIRKEDNSDINFLDLKQRLPKVLGKSKIKNINNFLKKYHLMKKYLKSDDLGGQCVILYAKK